MGTFDRGSQATNSTVALRAMVDKFPGGHRREVTPVPIPNTEVKLSTADGTAWATAWESRSLPGLFVARRLNKRRAFLLPIGDCRLPIHGLPVGDCRPTNGPLTPLLGQHDVAGSRDDPDRER
jgi:hypothetical protein